MREVQVYPSAGKLVIGLRLAKASDSDPNAGQWSYLSGALKVDDASKSVALADLDLAAQDGEANPALQQIVAQLKQAVNIDYGISYQNLLMAANQRLTRPLKDGFRMEGKLILGAVRQGVAACRRHHARAARQRRAENPVRDVIMRRTANRKCWHRRAAR